MQAHDSDCTKRYQSVFQSPRQSHHRFEGLMWKSSSSLNSSTSLLIFLFLLVIFFPFSLRSFAGFLAALFRREGSSGGSASRYATDLPAALALLSEPFQTVHNFSILFEVRSGEGFPLHLFFFGFLV